MKFNTGKRKVLHLGRNNPRYQDQVWPKWLESNLAGKDVG